MKRKALALVLALVLALSAVSGAAMAAPAPLSMPEPVLAPAALPELVKPQAASYSITMTSAGPGRAELYADTAGARESVYFLADPEPGYEVSFKKCGYYMDQYDMRLLYIGNNIYEIIMPDGDVLLNLEFVEITSDSHSVKVTTSGSGTATVDQKTAKQGEHIFVTVDAAPGYSRNTVRARSASGAPTRERRSAVPTRKVPMKLPAQMKNKLRR